MGLPSSDPGFDLHKDTDNNELRRAMKERYVLLSTITNALALSFPNSNNLNNQNTLLGFENGPFILRDREPRGTSLSFQVASGLVLNQGSEFNMATIHQRDINISAVEGKSGLNHELLNAARAHFELSQ